MSLRVIVVDDEPLARKRLRRLLAVHADVEVVGEAASGDEAVGLCLRERPAVCGMIAEPAIFSRCQLVQVNDTDCRAVPAPRRRVRPRRPDRDRTPGCAPAG